MKNARELISTYMKAHGITKTFLAERLNESLQNMSSKLSKDDLTTDYIRRISEALQHNFFLDLAREYESENQIDEFMAVMAGDRPLASSEETIRKLTEQVVRQTLQQLNEETIEYKKQKPKE